MNFAAIICVMATLMGPALGQVLICYITSSARNRTGNGKYDISDIDPDLCTHYVYLPVGVTDDGDVEILNVNNQTEGQNLASEFVRRVGYNPRTVSLAPISGWHGDDSLGLADTVSNSTLRATAVTNVVEFLQNNSLQGVSLDFKKLDEQGGLTSDKDNLIAFAKELQDAFQEHAYQLIATVGAFGNFSNTLHDISTTYGFFDYIIVEAYGMIDSSSSDVVGYDAPLFDPVSEENDTISIQNDVDDAINFWLDSGAPASKLVLGISTSATTFTLADTSETEPGSPSIGRGNEGPYTKEPGTLGYNELCELQLSAEWSTVWSDQTNVPYSYSGDQWVSHNNEQSVTLKADYAQQLGFGGVMMRSIDTDDFRGICGDTTYPLLNAVNAVLFNFTIISY